MALPTRIWRVTISERSKFGTSKATYATLIGLAQSARDAADKAWRIAFTDALQKVANDLYVSQVEDMGKVEF